MSALPEPPDSLPDAPRAFYRELQHMLEVVRPARLDWDETTVQFNRRGVEVQLKHADNNDWTIWAGVADRDAIAGTAGMHEHFFAPDAGETEERPWTTEIVDFVAEILRGEVKVETTYRGGRPIAVRHFNLDENGQRSPLGYTGFLTPARFMFWREKHMETERKSFR
jgi:hypothetical protein